jgi:hypothetical protein
MNSNAPSKAEDKPSYQWVFIGMGAMMLAGIGVAYLPFFLATRQVQTFCKELPAGASFEVVRARAEAVGYEVSPIEGGLARLEDPQSYGRRTCNLRFGAQGLIATE